eukprot:m.1032020 g.1032020  ORF g.1032020 m.1032020 type:complete len:222 (+) comp24123_c1_seq17:2967-3632(+)
MSDGADKELVGDQISDLRDQIERATQLVTKSNGTPDLTAVDFVERLLRSQGGSYRLAQLSKFLKNSAPPGIVAECLPIRRWLDANADSFEVVMEHGAYVVNLRPKRTVTSDAAKDSGDTCFGVDDWIYFRCTGEVANVVNGIRRALGQLIDRECCAAAVLPSWSHCLLCNGSCLLTPCCTLLRSSCVSAVFQVMRRLLFQCVVYCSRLRWLSLSLSVTCRS